MPTSAVSCVIQRRKEQPGVHTRVVSLVIGIIAVLQPEQGSDPDLALGDDRLAKLVACGAHASISNLSFA
jgi:hypothetical protein